MNTWFSKSIWATSALLLSVQAYAISPTFDCAKAQGEVEQLICKDNALITLDRNLAKVYKAASLKASKDLAKTLQAEQRGWVKGRNDCWKANGTKTWITESWTVDTVKSCVEAQYKLRTSELQALWRLVPPSTRFYGCENNPANELVANFFVTDPATIRLERADGTVTLWRVGAANAGKYEGQNVSLVQQGQQLTVNWLNVNNGKTDKLNCTAK